MTNTTTLTEIAARTTMATLLTDLGESGPVVVEILDTHVLLDVFELEAGDIRLALSTLDRIDGADRAVTAKVAASDFYCDAVNNVVIALGTPDEWPLWDASIRVNS